MKKTKIPNYLITGLVLWFFLGMITSFSKYQEIWRLSKFNRLDKETRDLYLYGSDYDVYLFLSQTPKTTKILYLIPDAYYLPKSLLFLYPRQITALKNIKDLDKYNLENYDYLYIYVALNNFTGYILGLQGEQETWNFDSLYKLDTTLDPEYAAPTFLDYQTKVINKQGNLLYKFKRST